MIQKFKAAGVTTVIVNADPIAPKIFTEEATKQNYFPEWIFGGVRAGRHERLRPHLRPAAVGPRVRHQLLLARVSPELTKQYDLHTWYFGDLAPADDTLRGAQFTA